MDAKTISAIPKVYHEKCTSCSDCINACEKHAISFTTNFYCSRCIRYCMTLDVPCKKEHIIIDPELCNSCGECVTFCKNNALIL